MTKTQTQSHANANSHKHEHQEKNDEHKDETVKETTEESGLKKKDEQIADLTDTLKRVQAEFENYKKRSDIQNTDFRKFSNSILLTKIIPILETLSLALKHSDNKEEFKSGVAMIYQQLNTLLEQEGVKKIEALGQKFDPYRHEALLQEDSEKEQGIILEELAPGYILNDRVLKHSMVKVSTGKIKECKTEDCKKEG